MSVVAPDLQARLRTRHLPAAGPEPPETPCFADIVFAFDIDDQPIPRPEGFPGWWPSWEDGFGDLTTTVDRDSRRRIGWRTDEDVVFADLHHRDGSPCRVAPRQVLRRVRDALTAMGSRVRIGTEVEFFLTEPETDDGLVPTSSGRARSDVYAFAPPARDRAALDDIVGALLASEIGVQNWYAEGGPRQYEIALAPADPLAAADVALLTRYAVEEVAARHGLRASFRPKPGPGFGSGLHVHLSVSVDGVNVLRGLGAADAHPLGPRTLAGVLAVLHPATAMFSPSPSGYERLAPHTAAGTSSTWAHDNRSAGVRYLDRGDEARIEVRTAASDAHPHLVVAALVAGITAGLQQPMVLPPASVGDIYTTASPQSALPEDLASAADALRASTVLRHHLGDEVVEHYAATRDWAARPAPDVESR